MSRLPKGVYFNHCNKELKSSCNYPLSFPKGTILNPQLLYTWVVRLEPSKAVEFETSNFLCKVVKIIGWLGYACYSGKTTEPLVEDHQVISETDFLVQWSANYSPQAKSTCVCK